MDEARAAAVARSAPGSRTVARALAVCAAMLVCVLFGRLAGFAWTEQVSFDGAMNLEVARSLVEGQGYRRMYADHGAFSPAIQTRAPYILPAAGVFAAFGIGVWQAQLVNLVYVLALALLLVSLGRRVAGLASGIVVAAAVLAIPGIEDLGLNGYGELPALTWWLAGLLLLYPRVAEQRLTAWRCLGAGALFGIALVTKTVLAIGVLAALMVFLVHVSTREPWRRALALPVALLAGIVAPVLLHEAWHATTLPQGWLHWFDGELARISMQAGVSDGFDDTGLKDGKILRHLGLLAVAMQMPMPVLFAWLAAPFVVIVIAWRSLPRTSLRPLLLTLAVFVAIYLAWWLGVTPTQKAWYRRVFNGIVVANALGVMLAAWLWSVRKRTGASRTGPGVASAILLLVPAWFVLQDLRPSAWPDGESARSLAAKLHAIEALPEQAALYGVGWYSNPHVALYAGRHVQDIAETLPRELERSTPAVLLIDEPMRNAGVEQYWLRRYVHRERWRNDELRIVVLDASRPLDPFGEDAGQAATGYADFRASDYPYLFGFHARERNGWRWVRTDVEILLRYGGEPGFVMDAFAPAGNGYGLPGGVGITIRLDDCELGEVRLAFDTRARLSLPLAGCSPVPGQLVRARLRSDNLLLARDERQLSYVVGAMGFGAAGSTHSAAMQARR
jgi:hypothetical protein